MKSEKHNKAAHEHEAIKKLLEQSKHAEAKTALEKLISKFPDFALAHNDLGVVVYVLGEKAEALKHYERAHELDPENVTIKKNLADYYYVELKRIEDALKLYLEILKKDPKDIEILMILGNLSASLGRFAEATTFYQTVVNVKPGYPGAVQFLEAIGRRDGGKPLEDSADGMYQVAHQLIKVGAYEDGKKKLKQLIQKFPGHSLAHNDLGVLSYKEGNNDQAKKYYEEAIKLDPTNIVAMKNLADFYFVELKLGEEAIKLYVDVLQKKPGDIESLLALGNVSLLIDDRERARFFFNAVLFIEPWNKTALQGIRTIRNLT
jgi:tetratricopeptide (TPR) repeat protein